MNPSRLLNLLVAFLLAAVVFANPPAVLANPSLRQTAGEITGIGTICNSRNECGDFSLTFDPAGGSVTGSINVNWPITDTGSGVKIGEEVLQGTLTGNFDGEAGGVVSGTIASGQVTVTYSVTCDTCTNGTLSAVGAQWEGNLKADGTGNGWINSQDLLWNITYSAEAFQAGQGGNKQPTKTPGRVPTTTAQAPGSTITTAGQFCDTTLGFCGDISITFNPNGGSVTGSFSGSYTPPNDNTLLKVNGTLDGTYVGGDGGEVIGTITSGVWDWTCPSCDFVYATPASLSEYPWGGNLYADGTGSGTLYPDATWSVTFPAANFQAGLAAALPTETSQGNIQHQIGGISAEMGDKVWSEHELEMLKEVIGQLPPNLLNKLSLKTILRYSADKDNNGKVDPNVFGDYSSTSQTIRIYDRAKKPADFSNDTGDLEFKATILHEMIHALQFFQDDHTNYDQPTGQNPLVRDFINLSGSGSDGWSYSYTGGWIYQPVNGNNPPTTYGMSHPLEDMTESVMMYVYDPQKLQNSSPQRYNYIRDKIYGGTEYEHGKQKGK
jgi:hypothetical protein